MNPGLPHFAALASLTWLACAPVSSARELTFDEERVRLFVPEDFSLLADEELQEKYQTQRPDFALGNPDRSVSISVQYPEGNFPRDQINATRPAYAKMLQNEVRGIKWIKNDFITINGRVWIVYEFVTPGLKDTTRNIVLITSHRDRMLMINFAAASAAFKENEATLRKIIGTLALK